MKPVEIVVREKVWPLRGIGAITLWPFIFYKDGHVSVPLRGHEHYHWHEAAEAWVLPWYVRYVYHLLRLGTGGRAHPMESEAYRTADRLYNTQAKVACRKCGL